MASVEVIVKSHWIIIYFWIWFISKSLSSPDVPSLILGSSYPLIGNYNSEKKTKLCNYRCANNGGCEVQYTGPPRGGQIKGSCFPQSYGGSCSGTPRECNDCNQVLNCYEPKNWKQIKISVETKTIHLFVKESENHKLGFIFVTFILIFWIW